MKTFPTNSSFSDREISINPADVFNLKINPEGLIDYANHRFCEVSGYEEYELIGEPLDILKHPEMPQLFFEVLNDRLQKSEPMRLFIKFLSKDGRPFWVLMDFETKIDEKGDIIAHYAKGKVAPRYGVFKMETLNRILAKIESKTHETDASKRYLIGYLEERKMTYNKYIEEICSHQVEENNFSGQDERIIRSENTLMGNPINYDMSIKSGINSMQQVKSQNSDVRRQHSPVKKKKTLMKKLFGK